MASTSVCEIEQLGSEVKRQAEVGRELEFRQTCRSFSRPSLQAAHLTCMTLPRPTALCTLTTYTRSNTPLSTSS